MDCRIPTTFEAWRTIRFAGLVGLAFAGAEAGSGAARAQDAQTASPLSRACQPGSTAIGEQSALPNVAAALAKRKAVRILAFGAAPGRISARGGYTTLIEAMLQRALKGINIVMVNRGVSGELAANAATRMKNEVALEEPDLVLWQVGTNDALAYVPADEFAATVKEQIDWLKAHKVDVVLVGLQYTDRMLRDAHYTDVRNALRRVAQQENVMIIRFFEARQILGRVEASGGTLDTDLIERDDAGYNCLAQYVARAITLGVFGKTVPRRPEGGTNPAQ